MAYEDPIVEEVRRAGSALFAQFNNDMKAVAEELNRRSREAGRTLVNFPPRPVQPRPADARRAG